MSDSYQAVYDAVRSRISNGDIGDAVSSVMRDANFPFYVERALSRVAEAAESAAEQQVRPSVLYRPALSVDGNRYCALYGKDLVVGISGFGDSPEEAMKNFDAAWSEKYQPIPF